jgi:glucose-6-phosphate 1-epimerase
MSELQQLRREFEKPGISLTDGPSDLTTVVLQHEGACVLMCRYGAHVLDYQPRDQAPVLWLSADAIFKPPRAIRGGISICWP